MFEPDNGSGSEHQDDHPPALNSRRKVVLRPAHILQFGSFELRTDTGELRKSGVRVRLQSKPREILLALLEHPGEVVTRDQLRYRLWPADTFVDFESGLNTAANRLRFSLGDSADVPRFVETLPRLGYRFIAPVREFAVTTGPADDPAWQTERVNGAFPAARPAGRRFAMAPLVAAGGAALLIIGLLISHGWTLPMAQNAEFHQITFASGDVTSGRFAPDGSSVLYTRWTEGASQMYISSALSPESRAVGFPNATLAAVSPSGELAVFYHDPSVVGGLLTRTPMSGGPGHEITRDVMGADWAPDGESLAVIRLGSSGCLIEYPVGKVVFKCAGWADSIRISPSGKRLAFLEHPKWADDAGHIRLIDADGRTRVLSSSWASAEGLAWAPSEKEIWFTASKSGLQRSLYAVTLEGRTRTIATIPGTLRLLDVSRLGHVLVCRDDQHMSVSGMFPGSRRPQDLPGFDYSQVNDISRDGNLVLFTESGDAGGSNYSIYLHDHRAHTTARIGHGQGLAIAPDEKQALALDIRDQTSLRLIPLGAGVEKKISGRGLIYQSAMFFPDGRRLLVVGAYPGQPTKSYLQSVDTGGPVALRAPVCLRFASVSADSKYVFGISSQKPVILSLDTLEVHPLAAPLAHMKPVGWSEDSRSVLLTTVYGSTWQMVRANVDGGQFEVLASFTPPDLSGRVWMSGVAATPSGKSWVYSYGRDLSQLYVVDGWVDPARRPLAALLTHPEAAEARP